MSTTDIIDANGVIKAIQDPLAPGRAAADNSRPVALSTEDFAALGSVNTNLTSLIAKLANSTGTSTNALRITKASDSPDIALFGAVTETAPASDTASSGINGRLQRVAQNVTTANGSLTTLAGAISSARMAVNLISGQAGVVGGTGARGATTQRVTIATDDEIVGYLNTLQGAVSSSRIATNIISGQAGITAGAGAVGASTPRMTLASDDPAVASLSTLAGVVSSSRAAVNLVSGQAGITGGAGAVGASTPRVTLASDDPLVTKFGGTTMLGYIKPEGDEWETVAASQTDQSMGATGAAGDYLAGVLIVPATVNAGAVSIKDGSGSAITIFAGGTASLSGLVPFMVPLGLKSLAGAWKLTTGTNVSAIGIGNFT